MAPVESTVFDVGVVTGTGGILDWKLLGTLGFVNGFEAGFGIGFNNGGLLTTAKGEDLRGVWLPENKVGAGPVIEPLSVSPLNGSPLTTLSSCQAWRSFWSYLWH